MPLHKFTGSLVDLKMKENTAISSNLNDFNSIYINLMAQKVEILELVKVLFLLITLPNNWDTFCTTISNSSLARGLLDVNVTGRGQP